MSQGASCLIPLPGTRLPCCRAGGSLFVDFHRFYLCSSVTAGSLSLFLCLIFNQFYFGGCVILVWVMVYAGIDHFCIHAGGRGVIDGIEKNLALQEHHTEPSRATLRDYGNTSSSSIWCVVAFARHPNNTYLSGTVVVPSFFLFCFFDITFYFPARVLPSAIFWTSCGRRCRPFSPPGTCVYFFCHA